jgi:hypothetical protein
MATRGKRGKRSKPAALPTGVTGKAAVNQPTVTNAATSLAEGMSAKATASHAAAKNSAPTGAARKSAKATVRHLKCWRCGKSYAGPSRRLELMEQAKKRKGKTRVIFVGKRRARELCLCPACLRLDVAERQVEETTRPDYSDTPRDQRELTSRLNIRTRYHG